jgi:hypothetical protein
MRRSTAKLLAFVLLLLAAVVTGLWWWATGRMEAQFAASVAAAAREGWRVQVAETHRAGWPFAAELELTGLAVSGGAAELPGGMEWRADHAVLRIAAWQPEVLGILVHGHQSLRLATAPTLPFTADRFTLTTPLRQRDQMRLEAHDLRFQAPLAGMRIGLLEGGVQVHPGAGKGQPALDYQLAAEAIRLPQAAHAPLGGRIASASLDGALEGPLPPATANAAPGAGAAAWRDGGGVLQVRRYAFGWGPLGATGSATIGLDASLQPEGTGTLRAVGYDAALASLAESGTLAPSAAQAIRAVLGLIAHAPEGGGASEVTLPLALHQGVLTAGRIPVGRLPSVGWSASP